MEKGYFIYLLLLIGLLAQCGQPATQPNTMTNASAASLEVAQAATTAQQPSAVIWTNLNNCQIIAGKLQKSHGRSDSPDAGAYSAQSIRAGDGYVEFSGLETNADRYLGLSNDYLGTSYITIDYAFHLMPTPYRDGFIAEVRENGEYKAETTYTKDTTLRIAVEAGEVRYYKDGIYFYASRQKLQYPLVVDVSLINLGATTGNALFGLGKSKTVAVKKAEAIVAEKITPGLTAKLAYADGIAGIPDDNKAYLPEKYLNFAPPPVGVKYNDAVFGSAITRLSNGLAQFKDAIHHEYATMSPFNKNSSLILLLGEHQGYYVVDRSGKIIVHPSTLVLGGSAEPRWSGTDPYVFYYHEENQLKKYNINTRQKTLMRSFSQYQKITFGGGEGDISEDGDHIMIVGDERYVGMYTFSNNSLGRAIDLQAVGAFDEVYVTANNNVVVRWAAEGEGNNKGMGLFDKNMNFIRQIVPFVGHNDQGRDVNGDEVLLIGSYRALKPTPGCENSGIVKVRLSDSKKTCLVPLNWQAEMHVSSNSNGRNPWVLVSVTDTGHDTATADNDLARDWQRRWGVRFNELILVKVDGSVRKRLAHHQSRVLNNYWYQPHAALSRDGNYAVFDSNFGIKPLPDYSDVFLLHLKN